MGENSRILLFIFGCQFGGILPPILYSLFEKQKNGQNGTGGVAGKDPWLGDSIALQVLFPFTFVARKVFIMKKENQWHPERGEKPRYWHGPRD